MSREALFRKIIAHAKECRCIFMLALASTSICLSAQENPVKGKAEFCLWAISDPHVFSDLYLRQKEIERIDPDRQYMSPESGMIPRIDARENLSEAILQSESENGFYWDIAVCPGDYSGSHDLPTDLEGREVVKQFSRLRKHTREAIYSVAGNHDASIGNQWFQKWIDPMGINSEHSGVNNEQRPFPVEGTWERYSFRVGNILFLMLSDRNDFAPPVGCIVGNHATGGHPPGAVTVETFNWWKRKVLTEPDETIIITVHHHMLKETTIGSGEWEGYPENWKSPEGHGDRRYHGFMEEDGEHNKGAGYLYWLVDDSVDPIQTIPDARTFEQFLAENPGIIDFWIGGHTHTDPGDRKNGRTQVEKKWGVHFINVAALSIHHGGDHSQPLSRLFTFSEGSNEVRIQCYLHTNRFAPQGWYEPADRLLQITNPFKWE